MFRTYVIFSHVLFILKKDIACRNVGILFRLWQLLHLPEMCRVQDIFSRDIKIQCIFSLTRFLNIYNVVGAVKKSFTHYGSTMVAIIHYLF